MTETELIHQGWTRWDAHALSIRLKSAELHVYAGTDHLIDRIPFKAYLSDAKRGTAATSASTVLTLHPVG